MHLVGEMKHPDVENWFEDEVCIPEKAADLRRLILISRKLERLGAEIYTEQFRCVSNKTLPSLAHTVYVEANQGKSGFLHLKYWFAILDKLDGIALSFQGWITDGCSVGISAGTLMATPTDEMIALGCSYIGLPVDDFN